MSVVLVGVSHKTAPIEIREKLTVSKDRLETALQEVRRLDGIHEVVLLSTCNRLEVYARPEKIQRDVIESLYSFFQRLYDFPKLDTALYQRESYSAIEHLFRVASGLDSLVVGETDVLGQVKSAYQIAHDVGTTGKITNVMFQRALFVGKQIRMQTEISEGASSVGNVAVQLAHRIFGQLINHRILLLGAGKMAEVAARHMLSQKASNVMVLNRTEKKAQELARLLNGQANSLDKLEDELLKTDIVICSVSSDQPLLSKKQVEHIMKARRQRSLYFIDIAVPRNVDPEVHDIDNVYVYNIDDLKSIVDESMSRRQKSIDSAEILIKEMTDEFQTWIAGTLQGKHMALRHYPHKV